MQGSHDCIDDIAGGVAAKVRTGSAVTECTQSVYMLSRYLAQPAARSILYKDALQVLCMSSLAPSCMMALVVAYMHSRFYDKPCWLMLLKNKPLSLQRLDSACLASNSLGK
jgi:hypothetical protein